MSLVSSISIFQCDIPRTETPQYSPMVSALSSKVSMELSCNEGHCIPSRHEGGREPVEIRYVADNDLWVVVEEVERLAWAEHRISRYIPRCIRIFSSYDKKLLGGNWDQRCPSEIPRHE